MGRQHRTWSGRTPALVVLLALGACSLKKTAVHSLADALVDGGSTFASDDDPELVRQALPFALKTMEILLEEAPEHRGLLVAACAGFTQYAKAFVDLDADLIEAEDYALSLELRERALKLYLRALGYGLRSLESSHPGIGQGLRREPEQAAARIGEDEVPGAFWTAAAWGSAISVALDQPEIVADVDAVRALLRRVIELQEDYDDGGAHEVMIAIESLPEAMGGSPVRARRHFERALELSGGRRAGPYVVFAEKVLVPSQEREAFEGVLDTALAVDPDADPEHRLANLLSQKRARFLLRNTDDLFL